MSSLMLAKIAWYYEISNPANPNLQNGIENKADQVQVSQSQRQIYASYQQYHHWNLSEIDEQYGKYKISNSP